MKVKKWIVLFILVFILFALFSFTALMQKPEKVVLGSKLFNEQYILAHMIAHLMRANGLQTDVKESLGGTMINYEALKKGNIDAYVEYTGTAYNVILKLPPLEQWDPDDIYQKVEKGLMEQDNIAIAARLGFRDDYAIALHKDWVKENNVVSISDLEPFTFGRVRQMQPTLMYEAIKSNQVDAIGAYTTDSRVDLYNLSIVEDDKGALPPYDAVIIVRKEMAENEELMKIFKILEDQIDTETMRRLNRMYDIDKKEASDIAKEFLIEKGFIAP
jgi:osmoprotectant transport system substrate-binding protein